ncbi:hypothetical protein C493_12202 [Natronolimnohabitans innermongolicus JCM 12255]|uniref:Uncharacterized protein n=1 Tax=Natronolimnohabitans innermongolicus JCM 12255 TaxID=1227499 RepID=L9X2N9_9EURY|nr:hypothetical protein C493_12202 [Natronolimnohabitans innermongolicus JCM 12255]
MSADRRVCGPPQSVGGVRREQHAVFDRLVGRGGHRGRVVVVRRIQLSESLLAEPERPTEQLAARRVVAGDGTSSGGNLGPLPLVYGKLYGGDARTRIQE